MPSGPTTNPPTAPSPGSTPLSPAERQRLQQLYEHATRNTEKNDYDYANDLFAQCVIGDPSSLVYLQGLLANLQKKYNNNKKGSNFAGLRTSSARKALKTATSRQDWRGVIKAGCEILKFLPWDTPTLLAMSAACREMAIDECQLFYLRWALNAHPKDPEVNKRAAQALARMGQFDQAIVCWHRVEEAKPGDVEAAKAISQLTVEKTIHQGGYSREAVEGLGPHRDKDQASGSVRRLAAQPKDPAGAAAPPAPEITPEQRLRQAIDQNPTQISNYCALAELLLERNDLSASEAILSQALSASGGGDLKIREQLEEVRLRRCRQQLEIAERRAVEEATEESQQLAHRMRAEVNQRELEIFAARVERNPGNPVLHFELGVRLKRAGNFHEAIKAFQAAREDTRRKAVVHLELGECFQKIEQFKLALSSYETAIAESAGTDQYRKLALYRAGVLASGLRDLDRAEKHLTELAGIDFAYRDVAARLDKLTRIRHKE